MKKIIFTLTIITAILIGLFQFNRIDNTYFTKVSEAVKETKQEHIMDMPPEAFEMFILPPDSTMLSTQEPDTAPRELEEPTSGATPFQPSDRALETKFWLDTVGSFLTTIAPFAVPFIMYRKKGDKDESE